VKMRASAGITKDAVPRGILNSTPQ
jgi:hypothetical protein